MALVPKLPLLVVWQDGRQYTTLIQDPKLPIQEIWMVRDGHGPSAKYDRIHVLYENGQEMIFPAHLCERWMKA